MKSFLKSLVVLSAASAAVAEIKLDPVHNTCGGTGEQIAKALLADIVQLGQHAAQMMDGVQNNRLKSWDLYRVYAAYNSFFDESHATGVKRWNDVEGKLKGMGNLPNASPNILLACDDAPFWGPHPTQPDLLMFHDPNTKTDVAIGPGQLTCASAHGSGKELLGYRLISNGVAYIFFCGKQTSGDMTLKDLSPKTGSTLDDQKTLSTILFHEMLHALYPQMRGDMAGGTAAGGERYGFQGAQEVRQTYADENPDSLTLFALSLAFDNLAFDTGIAEDKNTVINRLKQSPQGTQLAQKFGLIP